MVGYLPRGAEDAAHGAPGLRRYAGRPAPVGVRHEHRLDQLPVGEAVGELLRPVLAGLLRGYLRVRASERARHLQRVQAGTVSAGQGRRRRYGCTKSVNPTEDCSRACQV